MFFLLLWLNRKSDGYAKENNTSDRCGMLRTFSVKRLLATQDKQFPIPIYTNKIASIRSSKYPSTHHIHRLTFTWIATYISPLFSIYGNLSHIPDTITPYEYYKYWRNEKKKHNVPINAYNKYSFIDFEN